MMRLATLVGVAAVATLFLAGPQVARAECPYVVIPPATDGTGSAREVIVGTVVKNVGGDLFDFRLRIDHVLRGGARVGEVRRFSFLYPGWPPNRKADGTVILTDDGKPFMPCEPIPGAKGNVIAFALGALAPDGKTRYNAASWISGRLPVNQDLPRTTLAEIKRLAAMPDTATAADPLQSTAQPPGDRLPLLALGSALGLGALVAWRRARRTRRRAQVRVPPAN
jgi:hypothetical protein